LKVKLEPGIVISWLQSKLVFEKKKQEKKKRKKKKKKVFDFEFLVKVKNKSGTRWSRTTARGLQSGTFSCMDYV
jgi:hypothetical protein